MIVNAEREVLIVKRPESKSYAGLWEFRGGKLEKVGSPSEAATRELLEELGIQIVKVGKLKLFDHAIDSGKLLRFHPFILKHIAGDITLTEHTEFRWITLNRLSNFNFSAPDYRVVSQHEHWSHQSLFVAFK